jgi:hypothetical protein
MWVWNFDANPLRENTSIKETNSLVDKTYKDKAGRMRSIFKIKADKNTNGWNKINVKKTIYTNALFAAVTTVTEKQTARLATTVLPHPGHNSWYPFFGSSLGSLACKKECLLGALVLSEEEREDLCIFFTTIKDKGRSFLSNIVTIY